MSKKIKAIVAILLACAIVCGAFIYMHRTKERFVIKTLSLKEIGIDVNTATYLIYVCLREGRLFIILEEALSRGIQPQHFVYLYNFTTEQTTNLTSIFNGALGFPGPSGDILIWMEEPEIPTYDSPPDRRLCIYNLTTNTNFVIYAGEGNRRPLVGPYDIFGDWMTWRSGESDDGVQWTNIKTHLYNLKTGKTIYLPEGFCIGIYENDAICDAGTFVYRYNLTTGKALKIIEEPAFENFPPFLSGSRIIYNANNTLYCYNLDTEKKEIIIDNYSYTPPVLEGDKLFWVDHEEDDNTVRDTLYLYNLTTKENTKICEETGEKPEGLSKFSFVTPLDAYDNMFVWIGYGFDPDKRLLYWSDLYYVEL